MASAGPRERCVGMEGRAVTEPETETKRAESVDHVLRRRIREVCEYETEYDIDLTDWKVALAEEMGE